MLYFPSICRVEFDCPLRILLCQTSYSWWWLFSPPLTYFFFVAIFNSFTLKLRGPCLTMSHASLLIAYKESTRIQSCKIIGFGPICYYSFIFGEDQPCPPRSCNHNYEYWPTSYNVLVKVTKDILMVESLIQSTIINISLYKRYFFVTEYEQFHAIKNFVFFLEFSRNSFLLFFLSTIKMN